MDETETADLCSLIEQGLCSSNKPTWALEGVGTGRKLRVCDRHLPDAIRVLGVPALVDFFTR
jgi:hypothetical protein